MTTMLHLLAVAGVVILVVLVLLIPSVFIVLGLQDRRDQKREAEQAEAESILPSQFGPVPPNLAPHKQWPDAEPRRSPDEQNPDS